MDDPSRVVVTLVSDVHTEFHNHINDALLPEDPLHSESLRVCVIAGDLGKPSSGLYREYLQRTKARFDHVVVITGNHEYWKQRRVSSGKRGSSSGLVPMNEVDSLARSVAESIEGCHFLQMSSVVIGGARFIGCTLWTDIPLEQEAWALAQMNDYQNVCIQEDGDPSETGGNIRKARPSDIAALHHKHREWLRQELATPFDGPTVVVTHHLPALQLVDPGYHGDRLRFCFASDALCHVLPRGTESGASADAIRPRAPVLWCHGHTHSRCDVTIGETRFVRNPVGYPSEQLGQWAAAHYIIA